MRWESLVPVVGGRHCDVCRKTVIDVERLTSAEVDALVESGERACVRVTTLPDGSVLTRDHRRAPGRAAAWAGATLAASAIACSEGISEDRVAACGDGETQTSARSTVAEDEPPAVHRSDEAGPRAARDRTALVTTVGAVDPAKYGGFEPPPPAPPFHLGALASDPAGTSGDATATLGSIGQSWSLLDETPFPMTIIP